MRGFIGILAVLLAVTALARYYIFDLDNKDIAPEFYERKMRLSDFTLPEKQAPEGYRLGSSLAAGAGNPATVPAGRLEPLTGMRFAFPAPDRASDCQVTAFASAVGDRVLLVACLYGTQEAPEEAPTPPDGYRKDGAFLVTAAASTPLTRERFLNALDERLTKLRTDTRKIKKLQTIGNVTLKFFMDLLIGAFAFMLALFIAKYFLVLKNVEG